MNALSTSGLVKRFGSLSAVDGVTLAVPDGSTFGLIGPNGAGKTTLMGLACGWLRPTSGRIEVLGSSPFKAATLKGQVAALPQDAALPPNTSVFHSLTYYGRLQGLTREAAGNEARRVLELVGLTEWMNTKASNLSHGMAKRVGLAQAFIGSPRLLVLDEPTAGLDPKSAHLVRSLVKNLRGQATIIISSHNLNELESVCDHAAIMDRGQIKLVDTMAELTLANSEVVITFGNPPAMLQPLADAATTVPGVSTAAFDHGTNSILIRFSTGQGPPEDTITAVLSAMIGAGAKIGSVVRGQGLERKVLSMT